MRPSGETVKSAHGEHGMIESGTSRVITVYKEAARLGVNEGDPVAVRFSRPSATAESTNRVMELSGGHRLHNADWVVIRDDDIRAGGSDHLKDVIEPERIHPLHRCRHQDLACEYSRNALYPQDKIYAVNRLNALWANSPDCFSVGAEVDLGNVHRNWMTEWCRAQAERSRRTKLERQNS